MISPYFALKKDAEASKQSKRSKKVIFNLAAGDKSLLKKKDDKKDGRWASPRRRGAGANTAPATAPAKSTRGNAASSGKGKGKAHPKYATREEHFAALSKPRFPVPSIRVVRPKKESKYTVSLKPVKRKPRAGEDDFGSPGSPGVDLNASAPAALANIASASPANTEQAEEGNANDESTGDSTFITAVDDSTLTTPGEQHALPPIENSAESTSAHRRRPRPKTVGYTGSVLSRRRAPSTPVSKLGRTYADAVLPPSPAVSWLSTNARLQEEYGISDYVKGIEAVVGIPATFIDQVFRARCKELKVRPDTNRAQRFISVLENCCKGTVFDVHESGLGGESAVALCHALAMNEVYTTLNVSANNLRDRGAEAVARLLSINPRIVQLDLRSNGISHKGGTALFDSLKLNTTLTHLEMSGLKGVNRNNIGDRPCALLSEVLEVHPVLHTLTLGSNGITAIGAQALKEGLVASKSLRHLDLSGNKLGPQGAGELCNAICESGIETLILAHNGLGDLGCIAIEDMLRYPEVRVTHLDLSDNDIEWRGGGIIGQVLGLNSSLRRLVLNNNKIGNLGSVELAASLRGQKTLRELSIVNCFITSDSTDEWTHALTSEGCALERLEIASNELGDQGGIDFARGLKHAMTLEHLDLSNTLIGDRGGAMLAKSLKTTPTLSSLKFRGNPMGDAVGMIFETSIKSNPHLRTIDFGYNGFSFGVKQSIDDALKKNAKQYTDSRPDVYKASIQLIAADLESFAEIQGELDREKVDLQRSQEMLAARQRAQEQAEHESVHNVEIAERRLFTIKDTTLNLKVELTEKSELSSKRKTALARKHDQLVKTSETEHLASVAAATRADALQAEFEGFDLLRQGQLEERGRQLVKLEGENDVARLEAEALEAKLQLLERSVRKAERAAARGKKASVRGPASARGETVLMTDPVTGKQRRAVKS